MIFALLACGGPPPSEPLVPACRDAVAFDLDGTLTLSDDEYLMQVDDPTYVPVARPDAAALVQFYVDAGFTPIYISGRPEHLVMSHDRNNRDVTEGWLSDQGFVFETEQVHLSDATNFIGGTRAVNYKASRIRVSSEAGFLVSVGYAGGDSDLEAFQRGEVTTTFRVGATENDFGATNVPDEDAFTNHLANLEITPACP